MCMSTSFPNFALFVFICQFQGFLPWCNSCTCPPPWDDRCAERKHAVWIGLLLDLWDLVAVSGLKEDFIFYIFGRWTLWNLRNAITDPE